MSEEKIECILNHLNEFNISNNKYIKYISLLRKILNDVKTDNNDAADILIKLYSLKDIHNKFVTDEIIKNIYWSKYIQELTTLRTDLMRDKISKNTTYLRKIRDTNKFSVLLINGGRLIADKFSNDMLKDKLDNENIPYEEKSIDYIINNINEDVQYDNETKIPIFATRMNGVLGNMCVVMGDEIKRKTVCGCGQLTEWSYELNEKDKIVTNCWNCNPSTKDLIFKYEGCVWKIYKYRYFNNSIKRHTWKNNDNIINIHYKCMCQKCKK
jgi:uncharacterized protein YeeX (DUF496 family)